MLQPIGDETDWLDDQNFNAIHARHPPALLTTGASFPFADFPHRTLKASRRHIILAIHLDNATKYRFIPQVPKDNQVLLVDLQRKILQRGLNYSYITKL